ncbi:MAG TPA: amidohydrolase [Prolixibacteraceae bacterium]|nr:amidohydrolase [Prolixibacteraceae bacterium]HPR59592.1 amidohydrolase [Prolixibacteraceae bacterium]
MRILIKNCELNHLVTNILIEDNIIKQIAPDIQPVADKVIDATRKAVVPGMFNGHTHAAMTLMRGYADDMPLMPWLQEKIWPLEKNLTEDDVYWGTKLACLEMIKTGTTSIIDMYHFFGGTARAVDEMGLRGMLTYVGFDFELHERASVYKKEVQEYHKSLINYSSRIGFAMAPHAIYSVSKSLLKWIRDYATDNGLRIHTHISETIGEVNDSIKKYGLRPVQYLQSIGFLGPDVSFAHGLYLDSDEIKILADNGCQVIHNPASNLKLASGNHFLFRELKQAGVPIALGTDGTSSGNNLDMYETMKLASLTGKVAYNDPTVWNANETFEAATASAEKLTGLKTGKIEVGYLADLCLIDLNLPELTPNFNLISNLVYSANGNCVDTVICDGKVLMENRRVPGEDEIMKKAAQVAYDLAKR